jgi:hypothetical protein
MFYDETIGDGITSCYEMFIACCGYKMYIQLYNVKSLIKATLAFSGHSHSLPQHCVTQLRQNAKAYATSKRKCQHASAASIVMLTLCGSRS